MTRLGIKSKATQYATTTRPNLVKLAFELFIMNPWHVKSRFVYGLTSNIYLALKSFKLSTKMTHFGKHFLNTFCKNQVY